MILKAATTAQDQGIFTAVISTSGIDREKDVVDAGGMVTALHKWVATGKQIPLAWNHSTSADQIIGSINPASAKDVGGEVVVAGRIDMSTDTGAHAWRLIKAGVVGFSFGYLVLNMSARKGGGRNITELDVFEITATPTPMNNATRVLDFKASVPDPEPDPDDPDDPDDEPEPEPDPEEEPAIAKAVPADELAGVTSGELKMAWSTAYQNDLPDSAFLYIAPGGTKDSDGKTTPRSLRYFPVRDANGAVDQAHVRNALARIPQSNLSQSTQDAATAKAKRLLDSSKSVDVTGKEPTRARPVDPLRRKADAVALEFLSDGESLRKPPPAPRKQAPP